MTKEILEFIIEYAIVAQRESKWLANKILGGRGLRKTWEATL